MPISHPHTRTHFRVEPKTLRKTRGKRRLAQEPNSILQNSGEKAMSRTTIVNAKMKVNMRCCRHDDSPLGRGNMERTEIPKKPLPSSNKLHRPRTSRQEVEDGTYERARGPTRKPPDRTTRACRERATYGKAEKRSARKWTATEIHVVNRANLKRLVHGSKNPDASGHPTGKRLEGARSRQKRSRLQRSKSKFNQK